MVGPGSVCPFLLVSVISWVRMVSCDLCFGVEWSCVEWNGSWCSIWCCVMCWLRLFVWFVRFVWLCCLLCVGGEMWVESEVDHGSSFFFTLRTHESHLVHRHTTPCHATPHHARAPTDNSTDTAHLPLDMPRHAGWLAGWLAGCLSHVC